MKKLHEQLIFSLKKFYVAKNYIQIF